MTIDAHATKWLDLVKDMETVEQHKVAQYKIVKGTPEVVEREVNKLITSNEGWDLCGITEVLRDYQGTDLIIQPMVQYSVNRSNEKDTNR